jgi:hypothetical protein
MSLAQSTNHQEDSNVGCRIVDRNRGTGHGDASLRASGNIDVIVSRTIVADILQRLGENCDHLRIERTSVLEAVSGNFASRTENITFVEVLDR